MPKKILQRKGKAIDGSYSHKKQHRLSKTKRKYRNSNIFLIDHAWTTKPENAKKEIKSAPGLLDRLETIMDIEKEEVVESDDEDEVKEDSNMIDVVAEQANVSREQAREALVAQRYDLVNAIMHLTMSEEFKAESERLQDQVLGQVLGKQSVGNHIGYVWIHFSNR